MPEIRHHTVNVTLSVDIGVAASRPGAPEAVTLAFTSGSRNAGTTANPGDLLKTIYDVIDELQTRVQSSLRPAMGEAVEDE